MINLLDYTSEELYEKLAPLGEKKFRVDQLMQAVYNGKDYTDNTNLPKDFLVKLQANGYVMQPIKIHKAIESKKEKGGTIKFLYELGDDNPLEY